MKIVKAQSLSRFSTMTHCRLAFLSLQLTILVEFVILAIFSPIFAPNFSYTFLTAVSFKRFFPPKLREKISSEIFDCGSID